jgi:DNA-directed RNA polymerase subunit RPC12/RpoP
VYAALSLLRGRSGYILQGQLERKEGRMSETRLVCRVCDRVFSEHQVQLKAVDPEGDQIQCPTCGSSRMEPYTFDPDAPTENPLEREEGEV